MPRKRGGRTVRVDADGRAPGRLRRLHGRHRAAQALQLRLGARLRALVATDRRHRSLPLPGRRARRAAARRPARLSAGRPLGDGLLGRRRHAAARHDRAPCTCCAGRPSAWHATTARRRSIWAASTCPGARRLPTPGEPQWGMYEHKVGFGARWVESAGAHEIVLRPGVYRTDVTLRDLRRRLRRLSVGAMSGRLARSRAPSSRRAGCWSASSGRRRRRPWGRIARSAPTTPSSCFVTLDSRQVTPGVLFAAAPGERADGHAFLDEAVVRGAAAVLVETPVAGLAVPQLVVARHPAGGRPGGRLVVPASRAATWASSASPAPTARRRRAISSAPSSRRRPPDRPARHGRRHRRRRVARQRRPGRRRPRRPSSRHRWPAMVEAGDGWAVVEASSHGLAQDRVGEVAWDVAVLTNVTEEHLEFHHTIEAYGRPSGGCSRRSRSATPTRRRASARPAVLNLDDRAAAAFAGAARAAGSDGHRLRRVGRSADPADRACVRTRSACMSGCARRAGSGTLALHLAGRFNAHNALAAVAVGEALDLEPDAIRAGLEGVEGVPGRMERIEAGQPFVGRRRLRAHRRCAGQGPRRAGARSPRTAAAG